MKTSIIIVGITGDLSRRKLLPALEEIYKNTEHKFDIIGISRRQVDVAELVGATLSPLTRMITMNLAEEADYRRLREDVNLSQDDQVLIYLAVPPLAVTQIVAHLGKAGLNGQRVKLLFEKPFGVDYKSADDMITETREYFDEENMYRIDHYLAKEMAQNIVAFRSHNALFAQTWSNAFIERIDLIASEDIDIEGRAEFYEQTGALRDILQGHLMQLLALTILSAPGDIAWDQLPQYRLKALRSLRSVDPTEAYRAQYKGYQEAVHNSGSQTETYVQVLLRSEDPRWEGVRFRLMTGKALREKTTEVRVHFKAYQGAASNCLRFRIQPNEGVEIDLTTKKPGYAREFELQQLIFSYPTEAALPDAYEQVLVDAIESRKSLFTSGDEILESWRVLQPLLNAWSMESAPLPQYPKGTAIERVLPS